MGANFIFGRKRINKMLLLLFELSNLNSFLGTSNYSVFGSFNSYYRFLVFGLFHTVDTEYQRTLAAGLSQ